jgi:hypothetical protein
MVNVGVERVREFDWRVWTRRLNAILGWPLIIAVAGCSTFDGLTLAKRQGSGRSLVCAHAGVQPRSPFSSAERDTSIDLVLAVRHLDIGDGANGAPKWDARTVGFDLDDTCTGEGEGPSCVEPVGAGIAQLDGRDGRDNAAGTFEPSGDAGGSAVDSPNAAIDAGGPTTVYTINGYNGLPVDGYVEVAEYAAMMGVGMKPVWGGDDEWHPYIHWTSSGADAGTPGAPLPMFKSVDAYVSNHILVARFDLIAVLPEIHFSKVIVQARLEQDATGLWTLSDGVFAGAMKADDSLQFIEGQQDPVSHDVVCRDSGSYERLKLRACALADISFSGNDASQPCDAISWAWKFDAVAARLSPEPNPATLSTAERCKPAERSPVSDHCAR